MTISVHLLPSDAQHHEPGHMCLSWQRGRDAPAFRGFVFRVQSLPAEFRNPGRWREYLFDHAVPGVVVDDVAMRDQVESNTAGMLTENWPASASQLAVMAADCQPGEQGLYSFNPDDHPGAHNCVTWTVMKVGEALGEVLPKVRQGRIKLMAELLRSRQAKQHAP